MNNEQLKTKALEERAVEHTPTQWAYDKACDALREAKQQLAIAVELLEASDNNFSRTTGAQH